MNEIPRHKKIELMLAGVRTFIACCVFLLNIYIAYRVTKG